MRRVYLTVQLLFISVISHAQGWEWMHGACDTGSENGQTVGQRIAVDNAGNIYAAGMAWFNGHIGPYNYSFGSTSDIPLVKYDSNGNLKWVVFAGPSAMPYGLATDPFGNEIMFGSFDGPDFTFGSYTISNPLPPGSLTCFISKVDSNGNVLWVKNLGDINVLQNGRGLGNCLTTDNCGNIYLATLFKDTFIVDNNTFISNGAGDIFVTKFDSAGNMLWGNSYGGAEPDWPSSVSITSQGDLYVAGLFKSDTLAFGNNIVHDTTSHSSYWTMFVAKFDATLGMPQWARASGGSVGCEGYGIATDNVGNVFVSGNYFVSMGYPPAPAFWGTLSLPAVAPTYLYGFLVKYDASGNEIWAKCTQGDAVVQKSLAVDKCDNIWLYGMNTVSIENSAVVDTIDGHIVAMPQRNMNPCFVTGWSNNGTYINTAVLSTGSNNDGQGIAASASGEIYVSGVSMIDTFLVSGDSLYNPNGHTGFGGHPYNMFVAKYSTGFNCSFAPEAPCGPVSTNNFEQRQELLNIFPNPTHSQLTIETSLYNYDLSLFNTLGQLVYSKHSCSNKVVVNVSSVADGVYYLQLEASGEVLSRKVVIQK